MKTRMRVFLLLILFAVGLPIVSKATFYTAFIRAQDSLPPFEFGYDESPGHCVQYIGTEEIIVTFAIETDRYFDPDRWQVKNLHIQIDTSDDLQFSTVDCYKIRNWGRLIYGESFISTKAVPPDGNVDYSEISLETEMLYLFRIRCAVINHDVKESHVSATINGYSFMNSGQTVQGASGTCRVPVYIIKPAAVTSLNVVGKTARAGIPFELKADVVPASSQIEWTLISDGNTGAIIANNVLFTVGPGSAVVEARVKGGNADGSDYVKQIIITVEPVRNLSEKNEVIGIKPNDFFKKGEAVSFQLISSAKADEESYGDYYYLPKAWKVDGGRWHFEDQSKLQMDSIVTGEHLFYAAYTTMRFNGDKWVDSGNDYLLAVPFSLIENVEMPVTGDSFSLILYGALIIVSFCGLAVFWKTGIRIFRRR